MFQHGISVEKIEYGAVSFSVHINGLLEKVGFGFYIVCGNKDGRSEEK